MEVCLHIGHGVPDFLSQSLGVHLLRPFEKMLLNHGSDSLSGVVESAQSHRHTQELAALRRQQGLEELDWQAIPNQDLERLYWSEKRI